MTQRISPVVDLFFSVMGERIAVDHGYALYGAISRVLGTGAEDSWLHESGTLII